MDYTWFNLKCLAGGEGQTLQRELQDGFQDGCHEETLLLKNHQMCVQAMGPSTHQLSQVFKRLTSPTMFSLTLLATILTTLTSATPISLPSNLTTSLEPWLITALSTHSPSGYPANHPYSRLFVTIADPNTITLGSTHFGDAAFPQSTANCTIRWLGVGGAEDPRDGDGWINPCSETDSGKWSVQILKPAAETERNGSATTDFVLRFGLDEAVVLGNGGVARLRFEGEAAFRVGEGENMGGACGGSGVCNWGLRREVVPVVVTQRLIESSCVAGTCEV